jgi:hypothetical protein
MVPITSQHDKPKRWRPRFSVRTLVIVVTLVCCYAACWGPTKTRGLEDVREYVLQRSSRSHFGEAFYTSAKVPLVVGITSTRTRYYFWFFGYVAKLPYERELPSGNPQRIDELFSEPIEESSDDEGVYDHLF